jgi:hypothetical protein
MAELSAIFGSLASLLGDLRGGKVKDATIQMLEKEINSLKGQVAKIQEDNTRLLAEKAETSEELARYRRAAESTPMHGANWVRKPGGGYDETPRCPLCGNTMVSPGKGSRQQVACGNPRCGHRANLSGMDIPRILERLEADWQASHQRPVDSA